MASKTPSPVPVVGWQRDPRFSDVWQAVLADGRVVSDPSLDPNGGTAAALAARRQQQLSWQSRLGDVLRRTFLPTACAVSVAPTFPAYCRWQAVQMTSGAATGVLSLQALLFAAGLGAGAIPMAAAINWVLKDGLGQLGGVLYASVFGTEFSADPKRQRLVATVLLQGATLLEVLTPLAPALFLPLASLSNIGKNIAILAITATRAQMHQSFALRNNLGDITGKITSQSIACSLAGTTVGVSISSVIGADPWGVLACVVPLSAVSVYANYRSSCLVVMTTLNAQRAEIVLRSLLAAPTGCPPTPLSPTLVAQQEQFAGPVRPQFQVPLTLNAPLSDLSSSQLNVAAAFAQHGFARSNSAPEEYALAATQGRTRVYLWFTDKATARDHLRGMAHACTLRWLLEQAPPPSGAHPALDALVAQAQALAEGLGLEASLPRAGWDLGALHIAEANESTIRMQR